MSKARLFLENFLIYGIGGAISKVIPLIMIPIVTRLMPTTEYYGLSDTLSIVSSFGMAIAVFGMYDALFRMFFEKNNIEFKKKVCSTSLVFTLIMSFIVSIVLYFLRDVFASTLLKDDSYGYLIVITAVGVFVGATNSIVSAPTRMQNKRKIYIITNTLTPLCSYLIAIILLLKGYYLIALPVATLISSFFIEVFFVFFNKNWFSIKFFDFGILKTLLLIAVPIAPNIIIYWLYNSCDRIMITNYIGIGYEGIYGIGTKIGSVSQLIYIAFSGGWQYFAFSTMKDKNQVETNSKIFEYLGVISFFVTILFCAFSSTFFSLLFEEKYYSGYIVSPYLFFAPLMQMLFQVAASQFTIKKKTYFNFIFLVVGAIVNIAMNVLLINKMGIEGAAIATALGYIVAILLCVIFLIKNELIIINKKFVFVILMFLISFFLWRIQGGDSILFGLCIATILLVFYILLYRKDIDTLVVKIKRRNKK